MSMRLKDTLCEECGKPRYFGATADSLYYDCSNEECSTYAELPATYINLIDVADILNDAASRHHTAVKMSRA